MEKTQLRGAVALMLLSLSAGVSAADSKPLDDSPNETAYFLSSSLPEKDLVPLMQAAEKHHLPVYFRGLINNDMKTTATYIQYLVGKYHITGINIDPLRFERYGINKVPALVQRCGENFDVVYGNVNLNQGLDIIARRGQCAGARQ
ncbi:type-F conjugative transfer system pilin assembly protein TrbC [Serratia marcescens]|uniref:type-F conjugative transfer system pilin assembly protein TrbC n=1 Tax=Serratia marcescens TaxID=615 RepID=UPI003204AE81